MKTLQGKTVSEWIDWLNAEGAVLAREGRDVHVTTHTGNACMGSVSSASSGLGKLTILTYGTPAVEVVVDAFDIQSVEIFNSRRLRPDGAYRQMVEMERIIKPNPPLNIDDTCP